MTESKSRKDLIVPGLLWLLAGIQSVLVAEQFHANGFNVFDLHLMWPFLAAFPGMLLLSIGYGLLLKWSRSSMTFGQHSTLEAAFGFNAVVWIACIYILTIMLSVLNASNDISGTVYPADVIRHHRLPITAAGLGALFLAAAGPWKRKLAGYHAYTRLMPVVGTSYIWFVCLLIFEAFWTVRFSHPLPSLQRMAFYFGPVILASALLIAPVLRTDGQTEDKKGKAPVLLPLVGLFLGLFLQALFAYIRYSEISSEIVGVIESAGYGFFLVWVFLAVVLAIVRIGEILPGRRS